MKKMTLLTLTCCLALLTACQAKTNKPETASSTRSTSASSSSKASSTEATKASSSTATSSSSASSESSSSSQTEASGQTTAESSSAIATPNSQTESQPPTPSNEELYATTLHLVATDTTPGRATHYLFADIDGNGTAELITAQIGDNHLHLAAIYYLQNGVPTYLARTYVAGGGGRRETFTIYHDGTVEWDEWSSGNGQGTAYLYQLAPDNSGHWVIGQTDFNQRELPDPAHVNQFDGGRMALDPASFNWTAF